MTHIALLSADDLQNFGNEPRIADTKLAEILGYDRPRKIRDIIRRHHEELLTHGITPQLGAKIPPDPTRGRPENPFMLNEAQAILVTMFSRTDQAAEARRQIVQVFLAWRHGFLVPVAPSSEPLALPKPIEIEASRPARFLEECERIAAEHGDPVEKVFAHFVSENQFRALRMAGDNLDNQLTKEMRWLMFMNMGMDLYYVLNGQRSLPTPD